MLLHISFSAMRTEGLLKLNSRSSSCKWVPNSTLNLSSVNRFLTSKVPSLFLLPFPIQVIIKRSFRLCIFVMEWLVAVEPMEQPVCKLCFPICCPCSCYSQGSQLCQGISCHQDPTSSRTPVWSCLAQQDGLNVWASSPAVTVSPDAVCPSLSLK